MVALVAVATLGGCSAPDDDAPDRPACIAPNGASVLASPHIVYASPDDRFGINVAETANGFRVTGQIEELSVFGIVFDSCVDASRFSGISFRTAGIAGDDELWLNLVTEDNDPAPQGLCEPRSDRTYEDCHSSSLTLPSKAGAHHFRWFDFDGGAPNDTGDTSRVRGFGFAIGDVVAPTTPIGVDLTIDGLEYF